MFISILNVALGGAAGACCRYLTGVAVLRMIGMQPFPVAVMLCNVAGSALMGAFVVLAAQRGLTHLSPLVMTGFLGGFTTFSSFSLETVTLIERGAMGQALLYVLGSVVLSIAAMMTSMWIIRGVLA